MLVIEQDVALQLASGNFDCLFLDSWLEREAVVARAGLQKGAVAGAVSADGKPLYWYSEIAGYYLSYLASRAANSLENQVCLKQLSVLVASYQEKIWSTSVAPLTRAYTPSHTFDWRNQGLFLFDIAMLLRGLADTHELRGSNSWDGHSVVAHLEHFFTDTHKLLPVHWHCSEPRDVPARWSTQSGPYQLKIVAALLIFARRFELTELEEKVLKAGKLLSQEFNENNFAAHNAHSICYALEGALLLKNELPLDLHIGKKWIENLAEAAFSKSTNVQLETNRSDVAAQLLRLCCCEPYANLPLAEKLELLLKSGIDSDGGVTVQTISTAGNPHKNTWTTLFARQALDLYAQVLDSKSELPFHHYRHLF